MPNYKIVGYQLNDMNFSIREGTSDVKSIDEVITRKGYARSRPFQFAPEAGETWFDLGANIGAFSLWALKQGASKVIAYEPDPESWELMMVNLREYSLAKRFSGHRAAVVADKRVQAVLSQNTANGNLWRNSIEKEWRNGETVKVACQHIEDLLKKETGLVCIKMDVEGSEMALLEWLTAEPARLNKIKKLVFEWSFDVDPDLKRFRAVMTKLKTFFPMVAPENMYEKEDKWPASWFRQGLG